MHTSNLKASSPLPLRRHPLRHYLRWRWARAYLADKFHPVAAELRAWINALLMHIPGRIGSRLRIAWLGFKRCGKHVHIWEMAWIRHPHNISLGDHVRIHPMTYIDGAGGIEIGSYVGIAPGVRIYSVNHEYRDPSRPYREQGYQLDEAVVIEDDVWIGGNSIILAGVRLRTGTVVAAGAVVTKDTEPFCIVAGVPARIIGRRGPSPEPA